MFTITVSGLRAAAIEQANNASFYGINKSFGNLSETTPGRIAAVDAVREYLQNSGIEYNSFWIIKARTIDTTGTIIPYLAEIDFNYD